MHAEMRRMDASTAIKFAEMNTSSFFNLKELVKKDEQIAHLTKTMSDFEEKKNTFLEHFKSLRGTEAALERANS